jgi:hypothetical protein
MKELYPALLQDMDENGSDIFPPEMDHWLRHAPLEWRRLGVCPASHRRFSIQLIPGWAREDITKNPTMLLAYDYNEDELRTMNMVFQNVTDYSSATEGAKRPLTAKEKAAVLMGDYSELGGEHREMLISEIQKIRDKFLSEATMGRNFRDGHVVMYLDGTTNFLTDREFAAERLRLFHRELMKLAKKSDGIFPGSPVDAVVALYDDEGSWWLKYSLGISPGNDEFIGWRMPTTRLTVNSPLDSVLMFDKDPYTHSGRNVLFLNGEVKFYTEGEFQALMGNPLQ